MGKGSSLGFSGTLRQDGLGGCSLEVREGGKELVLFMEYCIVFVIALFATYGIVHEIKK